MRITKPDRKEIFSLMIAGCLIGILCFAVIYGFKIVNPMYDGWLFHGDMDLRQHYVGFCHFKTTPWHFPIGLIDTLSVPYSMSVVYTDSIPLLALIFKLFRGVLPENFQYFGMFGLSSYMLIGALSPVLIRRFSDNKAFCIEGSIFFTLSFPILQRMFYHTALSAQWIIILALIVWVYTDICDEGQIRKLCLYWALIGMLSVLIHSYFVFMTGIVLAAQIIDALVRTYLLEKNKNSAEKIKISTVIARCKLCFLPLVSMGLSSFAILYILGGFYGKGSVSGYGFGDFNGNLSAYVNPLHYSSIFPGFELHGFFEYEGFAYVGAGILLILAVAAGCTLYEKVVAKKATQIDSLQETEMAEGCFDSISINKGVIIFIVILVLLASCFPTFSFGTVKFIGLPVPVILKKLLGICRTNARFVWVGMYLIILCALWYVAKRFDKKWMKAIFTIAVILQIFEVSGIAKEYHEKYAKDYEYKSVWSSLESLRVVNDKEEFVFMYGDSDIMMDTAFYAYKHGMSQNSYYYARTIYDEINENIAQWSEEFLNGDLSDKVVYVFRDEDYTDEFDEAARNAEAKIFQFDGHVAVTK